MTGQEQFSQPAQPDNLLSLDQHRSQPTPIELDTAGAPSNPADIAAAREAALAEMSAADKARNLQDFFAARSKLGGVIQAERAQRVASNASDGGNGAYVLQFPSRPQTPGTS